MVGVCVLAASGDAEAAGHVALSGDLSPLCCGRSMSAWLEHFSSSLVDSGLGPALFFILLFISYAEAAFFLGFVLPGETSLLIGGVLCQQGVFPLWIFLPAAIVSAILGDSTGYWIGSRFGPQIQASRVGRWIGAKRWRTADLFFKKYSGRAVFLGRSQALLRALVPAAAGMAKLRYRTFLVWNIAGAVVFAGTVVVLGYIFANSLSLLEKYLQYWGIALLALAVAGFIYIKRKLEALIEEDFEGSSEAAV